MKTMINIKADREVKENAQELARDLGLPLSGIITRLSKNLYLKETKHPSENIQAR